MISTQRLRLRAQSAGVSRTPSCTSLGPRKTAWPPSCTIPASKVTRVRRLGFSKIIARQRRASNGCGTPLFTFCLSSTARRNISSISGRLSPLRFNRSFFPIGYQPALSGARENRFENRQSPLDLLRRDRQRRREAQHFIGRAVEQQPLLHARLYDLGSFHVELQTEE